jgi:hypothetical protein
LLNGYDESVPYHERLRRFAELGNELLIQKAHRRMMAGELSSSLVIHESSDFPEGMHDADLLGYRSDNRKGMLRSTHLRVNPDGSYTRIIEQMSYSNSSPYKTFALMHSAGIFVAGVDKPDVMSLHTPLIYDSNDLVDGVVAIQKKLDAIAGDGIRYGDVGNPMHVSYEQVREVSAQREAQIGHYTTKLADFEQKLATAEAAGQITRQERQGQYAEMVRQILRAVCALAPEYAADCFGHEAARIYRQISYAVAQGDILAAERLQELAKPVEKTVTFCGVAITAEKAKELGLQVDSFGNLVEEGKESWKWKMGKCVVPKCSSPKPTEVGPCSVCRHCQAIFDKGGDPTKAYSSAGSLVSLVKKAAPKAKPKPQKPLLEKQTT